jgi:hypothetical protein
MKKPIISLEITATSLVFSNYTTFPLPEGAFGDAEKMAEAGKAFVQSNFKPKRIKIRLIVSTRQTVIRTSQADCPFDASTHIMQTDNDTSFFAAIPITLANSLVEMCLMWGISLYNIETLFVLEYHLLKNVKAESVGIFLPQEKGLRFLLADKGKLLNAYYISDEPAYLTTTLDRCLLQQAYLPDRFLYASHLPCPALFAYFNERKIDLCPV